jgi:hypothetical protein
MPRVRSSSRGRGSEVREFARGSFVFFSDPDGNRGALQQLPARG